jgi:hypothetical protein
LIDCSACASTDNKRVKSEVNRPVKKKIYSNFAADEKLEVKN